MVGPLVDSCEAIVASPTATAQAPWWSAAGLGRILQTVRFMSLHFPVDYERVVLVGVSDGAVGCYAASCAIPGPFAGFVAVSGYGGMLPSLGVAVIPGNMMQRPFYNIHAGQDRLFPLAQVNTFLDQLAAEGMRVERKEYPQEQHGFDYRAQEMGALAERVRQWRRPSGRTGLSWRIQQDLPWRADNLVSAGVAKGTAGIPAVNASWDRGRLTVSSIGVRSIVFLAERQEQPPVVVVNGRAEERCRDLSRDPASVLSAIQHRCVPQVPESAIYGATFSGE
jgi:pimeloyl-ACP methyl ester carboxylesterase